MTTTHPRRCLFGSPEEVEKNVLAIGEMAAACSNAFRRVNCALRQVHADFGIRHSETLIWPYAFKYSPHGGQFVKKMMR
jgi:hypothetical protein